MALTCRPARVRPRARHRWALAGLRQRRAILRQRPLRAALGGRGEGVDASRSPARCASMAGLPAGGCGDRARRAHVARLGRQRRCLGVVADAASRSTGAGRRNSSRRWACLVRMKADGSRRAARRWMPVASVSTASLVTDRMSAEFPLICTSSRRPRHGAAPPDGGVAPSARCQAVSGASSSARPRSTRRHRAHRLDVRLEDRPPDDRSRRGSPCRHVDLLAVEDDVELAAFLARGGRAPRRRPG